MVAGVSPANLQNAADTGAATEDLELDLVLLATLLTNETSAAAWRHIT
jgi:hypothetical protein